MKKKLRVLALLIVCTMVSWLFVGCGESKQSSETSTSTTVEKKADDTSKVSGEKKKIVVVVESDSDWNIEATKNLMTSLEKEGFSSKNSDITKIEMHGKVEESQNVINKIKEIKPDVAILMDELFSFETVAKAGFANSDTQFVCNILGSPKMGFFNKEGKPTYKNITGQWSFPKNLEKSSLELFNKISSLKGKKAIFIDTPILFDEELTKTSLQNLGSDLKEYVAVKTYEDYKEAIEKYNKDEEIGLIILGLPATTHRDGKVSTLEEFIKEMVRITQKPSISFWQEFVSYGVPFGFVVDTPGTGTRTAKTVAEVLKGIKAGDIVAKDPDTHFLINKKSVEKFGFQIPQDTINYAWRIYTDYEGNYMEK